MDSVQLNPGEFIISSVLGDVTGDGVPDTVYLVGKKENPSDIFIRTVTVVIVDGKTGRITRVPVPYAGYNPRTLLCDFTHDGVLDILVSIDSGGSGGFGFFYIFSFRNNQVQPLFDNESFNATYKYDVNFRNNFKVDVTSFQTGKTYTIDVHDKKNVYSDIYTANGILIKPVKGFVPGLNQLYPLESTKDGCDLLAIQYVNGLYNADRIGYIETTLTWDGAKFVLAKETVTKAVPTI